MHIYLPKEWSIDSISIKMLTYNMNIEFVIFTQNDPKNPNKFEVMKYVFYYNVPY